MKLPPIPAKDLAGLRAAFRSGALPVAVTLPGGVVADLEPDEAPGKPCRWKRSTTVYVQLNGKWVAARAKMSLELIGSKDWPDDPPPAE